MKTATTLLCAALALSAPAAFAQGSAPSAIDTEQGSAAAGSEGDSGTSLASEAETWIGQPVMTADGKKLGTLADVTGVPASTSEAGSLVVEMEDGTQTEVELQGAASDGEKVTVTTLTGEQGDQEEVAQ